MKKLDMGYKNLATMTFSFEESQEIAREVWDAYGATAFSALSGNMILELVNLAAAKAIASVKGNHIEQPLEMVESSAQDIVFYPAGSLGEEVHS